MKSSMKKTTRREIRNSFGRYFAILAIVALGVGFFAGLTVTTPAMVKTGGAYMNEKELFDLRLISTLGFEKEAVGLFDGNDEVKAVEGAVSTDFLALNEAQEGSVLSAQTLLPVQNQLELVAGRMPEAADECVVDSNIFHPSDIGTKIRISEENKEETQELFAFPEYKIVGIVNAVYYANYERGTTALGNGKVNAFVYLLPEGFDSDYDTEIFVRLKQDYEIDSEDYDRAVERLKDWAEPLVQEAAGQRYDAVMKEAEEKIADAEAELEEKTADAKRELSDAQKKITDGKNDLADAQEKIADGEKQLSDAGKQIADKEKELGDQEARLTDGRSQAEAGMAQLEQAKQQLQDTIAALSPGGTESGVQAEISSLQAQADQIQAQQDALQSRISEIASGEEQLSRGRNQLEEAKRALVSREKELEENRKKLEETRQDLEEGQKEYEEGREELEKKTAEAQEKIADAKAELAKIEKPDTYVLGRDTNVGYVCFQNDSSIVEGIAKVFPVFFFLVAALVCVTTMNRMVEEQRTQIGVLKALGYSESRIMGKYLYYSGSAAATGCVLGFIAGSIAFPVVIWAAYHIMYHLGEITLIFDWRLAVISLAVALLCSMGTTWLTCRYELASVAAELIRPKPPKNGKRILLEKIPFIWKRMTFLVKVSARNVFRYQQRFFMMIFGIGGCTALLLTGFGIKDSIVDVASQQYEKIQTYDMSVTLKEPFSEEDSAAADIAMENGAKAYTAVCEKALDLTGKTGTKAANVVIARDPEEMKDFLNLHTEKGVPIEWPQKGSAVMNRKLAEKCGIRIGDTVSLRNDDGEKLTVKVEALSQNFVYNYVYVNPDTWEADNKSAPEFKSLYIRTEEGTDVRALAETLLNCDQVSAVNVNADFMTRVTNMMSSLDYIVLLVIICAGALAFIVIYNLTNINITERIREIATIKVLGFYPMETAAYVFRENGVLTAVGILTGLVLGIFLHRFVMAQIDIDMITFDVRISPLSFLKSILLTFLFMIIVDVFMYIKLERINMAESLKSIE